MALSHEVFTDAQINGPKNVMGYPDISINNSEVSRSIFDNPHLNAPKEAITFLKLAEREGAYSLLSERTRQRLEMYYLHGKSLKEIADIHHVSKQAVSQTLKLSPESLFKQMIRDVIAYRTPISLKEISDAYSGYRIYLDKNKNRRK